MAAPAGKASNLRDRLTFPSFDECPHESDLDMRYYIDDHTGLVSPSRHWCFLGEIEDSGTIIRLLLDVKDVAGKPARIFLYTNDRGRSLASLNKKGHTVAILYPEQHNFADFSTGFRVEEPSVIKILPFSLRDLLSANDRIFAPPVSCEVADCTNTTDKKICSGCRSAVYCSSEHQKADWPQHKKMCRIAATVRWFTERDWSTFDQAQGHRGYWDFPES